MAVFGLLSLQVLVPRQFTLVCHSINMEWGVIENHVAVIALHNCAKYYSQIFKLLKPLKISRVFIYRAIKLYEKLSRVEDRAQSGHLKSLRAKPLSKLCRSRFAEIRSENRRSCPRVLNISTHSMSCLIRDNQHMTGHRHSKGHILTPALKAIRWTRAEYLQWHAENGHENILFTDEKIFTIEEQYNYQNNKIYDQMSLEVKENVPRVQGGHRPSYIMVWWEVSHHGVAHLHFCKKGVQLVSECIKRMCYKEL